jgi:hypothetical protein
MSASKPPLTIKELECGLRSMAAGSADVNAFWDDNLESFRRTLMFAIRDTSDALLSPDIPQHWRVELECQLEDLVGYIDLTDRYVSLRSPSRGRRVRAFPPPSERVH